MELRHLRYFVAVAEALNFSRAAERMRVTQPALSRQIRDLEQDLGCTLLRRGANARTELTPEGRRLLAGARALLAAADELTQEMRGAAARLRLGHYGSLWLDHFAAGLRRFTRRHPEVALQPVDLTPGALPAALRRGEVEVALLGQVQPALRKEFGTALIASVPAQLVLPADHPLAKRRQLPLAALREATWVSWDEMDFPGRKQLLVDACRAAGFRPRITHLTDSIASMLVRVATAGEIGHSLPMAARSRPPGVVFSDTVPRDAMMFEMYLGWLKDAPRKDLIADLVKELAAVSPAGR
jgi:LysR family transcriptional regulator, benzoate and cis,cis-muconate-responsive activator of ben and cat genes